MEGLIQVGVKTFVLAVSYKSEVMAKILAPWEEKLGVKIIYSCEDEPLGTAGPLALAREILLDGPEDEPFFVLNSDITSTFPFTMLLNHHKKHGKE